MNVHGVEKRRRDQVIEGARVWLLRIRGDAVVFGDLAMDPEEHRLFQCWEMGAPDLPPPALP